MGNQINRRQLLTGSATAAVALSVASTTGAAMGLTSTLMTAPTRALEPNGAEWWWATARDFGFADRARAPVMFATPNLKQRVVGRDVLGEDLFWAMERGARIKVAGHGGGCLTDVTQIVEWQHESHPDAVAARAASVDAARHNSVWLEGCTSHEWREKLHVWIKGDGTVVEHGERLLGTRQHPELKVFLGLPHRQPIAIRVARIWSGDLRIFGGRVLATGPQALVGA